MQIDDGADDLYLATWCASCLSLPGGPPPIHYRFNISSNVIS